MIYTVLYGFVVLLVVRSVLMNVFEQNGVCSIVRTLQLIVAAIMWLVLYIRQQSHAQQSIFYLGTCRTCAIAMYGADKGDLFLRSPTRTFKAIESLLP